MPRNPCCIYEDSTGFTIEYECTILNQIPVFIEIERLQHLEENDLIYKKFQTRLQTFKNWPHEFISPTQLAENGFIFTGESDRVRCVFCQVQMKSWEEGDSLAEEHRNQSPECPLARLERKGIIFLSYDPI